MVNLYQWKVSLPGFVAIIHPIRPLYPRSGLTSILVDQPMGDKKRDSSSKIFILEVAQRIVRWWRLSRSPEYRHQIEILEKSESHRDS